jgi:hypothetical protein
MWSLPPLTLLPSCVPLVLAEALSTWKSGYSKCDSLPGTRLLLLLLLSALPPLLLLLLLVVAMCAALVQPAGSKVLLKMWATK